jgi:hypothetical protein
MLVCTYNYKYLVPKFIPVGYYPSHLQLAF